MYTHTHIYIFNNKLWLQSFKFSYIQKYLTSAQQKKKKITRKNKSDLPIVMHAGPAIELPNIWVIANSKSPTNKHTT